MCVMFSRGDVYLYVLSRSGRLSVSRRDVSRFCGALSLRISGHADVCSEYKYVAFDGFDPQGDCECGGFSPFFVDDGRDVFARDGVSLAGVAEAIERHYRESFGGDGTVPDALIAACDEVFGDEAGAGTPAAA